MDAHQCILLSLLLLVQALSFVSPVSGNSKLFREYIGAEGKGVNFFNVPIHPDIDFHFILSFAIDYASPTSPTNGNFQVQWDQKNLGPASVSSIKARHGNVKVAMSLGGDSIGGEHVKFTVKSISSWVQNAITSLTKIVKEYHIDGIDIDYEHFTTDPNTFSECIGRLISSLKENKIISFASIAPFDNGSVQPYYLALWNKYGHLIDYVNFQFYAYEKRTTIRQFMQYFEKQRNNYKGGKVLVSIGTDGSGGLTPQAGFFKACERLKRRGVLEGIFIWSADDSKKTGFPFETQSQKLLAS